MSARRTTREQGFDFHYQLKASLNDTFERKTWIVTGDDGQQYVARMTRLDNEGKSRLSFLRELGVYSVLLNGNIRRNERINTPTPHGFSNVYFVGRHHNYDVIVLEDLSPSIYELRNQTRVISNTKTVSYLKLASDMLYAVMTLHQHGYIHRDIKPGNFKLAEGSYPYLIAFSKATLYINKATGIHYPPGRETDFIGTLKYSSLNAHNLNIQSRRDDLISLGYCIIEIIKGTLPWAEYPSGLRTFDNIPNFIKRTKEETPLRVLCQDLPNCVLSYMQAVTTLDYSSSPNYAGLQWMIDPNLNNDVWKP